MKLGGSLGNIPQKNEKRVIKTLYISDIRDATVKV
jgi:hypothetical protein